MGNERKQLLEETTVDVNITGVYTALVTPFQSDLTIDEDALKKLVEHQLKGCVDGILALGTTAETPTLLDVEKDRVVSCIANELEGTDVKLMVGVGTNATQKTISYAKRATELGADSLLVVSPYYNKPNQRGLYEHFSRVAEATDLPVVVYNIQGRTGVNIETPTLREIAKSSNIIAVKEASGNMNQMLDVVHTIARKPEYNFTVLSGDDSMTMPLLAAGGHGVISVVSNVVPDKVTAMVRAGLDGHYEEMRERHYALLDLMRGAFVDTNPAPVKCMLDIVGLCNNYTRPPIVPYTADDGREKLTSIVKELNI